MAEYTDILYQVRDRVARISFNRPEKLNAITRAMQDSLEKAVASAVADGGVRVIVLTGEGRGFSAGADMNLLSGISSAGAPAAGAGEASASVSPAMANRFGPDLAPHFNGRYAYLLGCPKPVIAAINGPAAGLGLVLSLYADIRFASASAKFTTAFSQRGLIAEHGVSWLLPRLVGHANALDLLMSSRKFGAHEALRLGLVNQVFDDAEFEASTLAYAKLLAETVSPRSLAVIKAQVYAALVQSFPEALGLADAAMRESFTAPDFKEGVAHFIEKRGARFQDLANN